MGCDEALLSFVPKQLTAMRRFLILSILLLVACSEKPGAISLRRGDYMHRDVHRELEPATNSFSAPDSLAAEDSLIEPPPVVPEPEVPPHIYACGVENPESAAPVFVVFEDGVRAAEYKLSAQAVDADSHFLIGADMYVVLTQGSETCVYKNGGLAFSFPAREYVSSVIARADGIWTLGVDRGGDGFALRKDGELVFGKSSGTPGRLYEDEEHLYFDYALTVGGKTIRYLVKDGDDFALTAPSGGELLAARVSGGEIWFLESGPDGWLLSCGEEQRQYSGRPGFGFRSAELYGTPDGCVAVVDMVAKAVGMPAELVCSGEETWLKGGGSGSYHYFDCAPDVHITFTRDVEKLDVCGFGGSGEEQIEGVRFEGERCAMQYEGQIYLACTPMDGSAPFIWKRGNRKMTLDLKGRLTGIYVEAPD